MPPDPAVALADDAGRPEDFEVPGKGAVDVADGDDALDACEGARRFIGARARGADDDGETHDEEQGASRDV